MNKQLTLGSLFDGSGGFPFAGIMCGIEPIWASEIEPFPIRVTTKRIPQMKHYGDISAMDGSKIEPVDIITFGFPCVDCSAAGLRMEIYAKRSGLFWEAMRVIDEMKAATNNEYPKWIIFENVPGLISSGNYGDFPAVLDRVQNAGFAVDINIFDAQFMGTAQRRRRIYCVGWNIHHILPMNTELSWTIITKALTEILIDTLAKADTSWKYPRQNPDDSRQRRMKLLGIETREAFEKLLALWLDKAKEYTGYKTADNTFRSVPEYIFDDSKSSEDIVSSCFAALGNIAEMITAADYTQSAYETAMSILDLAEGSVKNGKRKNKRQSDGEGADEMGRISHFRDCQRELSESQGKALRDFGERCAGEILSKREGVSGNPAQSRSPGKETAGSAASGIGETGKICMCDQGGCRIDITHDITSTLRAEAHHPPCVIEAAGFCTEHSAQARGIGYEEEKSPTLRAGAVPAAIALDYHPADSRIGIKDADITPTLTRRMGTGGNNVNLVMEKSNKESVFMPFGICSKESNSMKSDNPSSGFYEADTSRTIDTSNQSPVKNQGGIAVVCVERKSEPAVCVQGSVIGRKDKNGPNGSGINEDVSFTLNTVDTAAVAYGIDRAAFNQAAPQRGASAASNPVYSSSKASFFTSAEPELANTLVASDFKDPPLINDNDGTDYIIRRLTPRDCAVLQGFPPDWCSNLGTENPSEEDIKFWSDVWELHRKLVSKTKKPKSRNQIIKWLKDPHSDSAEYKMWGNGIYLNIVVMLMYRMKLAADQEN